MKNLTPFIKLWLLMLTVNCFTNSFAQISAGGTPPSFLFETKNEILGTAENLPITFNVAAMRADDAERKRDHLPPRVGKIIPVNFTTDNSGEWTLLPNGQDIWRLCIIAEDAIAIMLYYDKFEIPSGGKLFIYNHDRSQVLGAYTETNNPKKTEFATEFVAGDIITLEYVAPEITNYESPIIISGVSYGYNNLFIEKDEDDSSANTDSRVGACQVNINCPEGDNWQDQKKGVARIVIPDDDGSYLCSGSVVNNTANNLDPLFLSAYHCYEGISTANVNKSVYYFHYEYVTCTGTAASHKTLTGATILVNIPYHGGSDGTLLRLNSAIPTSYDVYYNGWDRRNTAATSGVGIHHPDGSRKKISTFTKTLTQAWGCLGMPSGAAWDVQWAKTQTNHGVTEGGSSGSPLFNQNKRIVGTLTAGSSDCSYLNGTDCYGKVWYHWNQHATQKMQPYLDPDNTGAEFIDGIYPMGCKPPKNLTVTYTEDCMAVLEWEAPDTTGFTFKVFRGTTQIASELTETTFTDTKHNQSAGYTWSVSAVYPTDESVSISVAENACKQKVTLSAKPANGGTVSGNGFYLPNADVTVDATPKANFTFVNWTKNDMEVFTEASYTFKITEDVELVANFKNNTGINENEQNQYFTIYPNPTENHLNVVKTNVGNAKIIIYNNIGVIMLSTEINEIETQINIAPLSAGVYFIRIIDNQNSSTQCFIKEY